MKIIFWDDFLSRDFFNATAAAPRTACLGEKSDTVTQTACSMGSASIASKPVCSNGQTFSVGAALTIGVFDGIHIGHKLLLDAVISAKTQRGYTAGIVTFTDSVFAFFKPDEKPLQSLEKRLRRFDSLGFDFVVLIDFTKEIASMAGTDFLEVLKEKCGLRYLVEGEDFRFGRDGATDMDAIKDFCEKNNIESKFIPPVVYNGERVSSSLIRSLLKRKEIGEANRLLGL